MRWLDEDGQSVAEVPVGYHRMRLEVMQRWLSDEWVVSVLLIGGRREMVTLRTERAADREAGKAAALAMARAWVGEAVQGLGGVA